MKIHIVVPITSDQFNEQIEKEARGFLGPEIDLEVSHLQSGPASIESFHDEVLAGPPIVAEVANAADSGADAVFITCFGDPAVPRTTSSFPPRAGTHPRLSPPKPSPPCPLCPLW